MKKFLLLSTLLCCTIITTLILGEFLVRTMSNPYKVKNKWMMEHSQNINSIILGSSHTYYGVRPEYVDSLYNLANVSQNPKYDYFMLEKYGNLCPNLKTVILPISYLRYSTKVLKMAMNGIMNCIIKFIWIVLIIPVFLNTVQKCFIYRSILEN